MTPTIPSTVCPIVSLPAAMIPSGIAVRIAKPKDTSTKNKCSPVVLSIRWIPLERLAQGPSWGRAKLRFNCLFKNSPATIVSGLRSNRTCADMADIASGEMSPWIFKMASAAFGA